MVWKITAITYDLHPSLALADFVREIKVSSSVWMKRSGYFLYLKGWADGYGSFYLLLYDMGKTYRLYKNQQEHHRKRF